MLRKELTKGAQLFSKDSWNSWSTTVETEIWLNGWPDFKLMEEDSQSRGWIYCQIEIWIHQLPRQKWHCVKKLFKKVTIVRKLLFKQQMINMWLKHGQMKSNKLSMMTLLGFKNKHIVIFAHSRRTWLHWSFSPLLNPHKIKDRAWQASWRIVGNEMFCTVRTAVGNPMMIPSRPGERRAFL